MNISTISILKILVCAQIEDNIKKYGPSLITKEEHVRLGKLYGGGINKVIMAVDAGDIGLAEIDDLIELVVKYCNKYHCGLSTLLFYKIMCEWKDGRCRLPKLKWKA